MGLTRQVIVGNSAAGLSAIKAIREVDDSCPITLISMESCDSYSPVLLTYYLKRRMDMVSLLVMATGTKVSQDDMKKIADRILTLERAFIIREGISKKDDILVGRFMDEPVHGGPNDGVTYDRIKWDKMLERYYELVGWDKNTGVPTPEKIKEWGLWMLLKNCTSWESFR